MIQYLLINNNAGVRPYKLKYLLFDNFNDCLKKTRELGGLTGTLLPQDPLRPQAGALWQFLCDGIDITHSEIIVQYDDSQLFERSK